MKKKLEHLAIIMDGNGRWAEKRSLPRSTGHQKGAETVGKVLKYAMKHKIKYLTLYAFSTENWKRSPQEVLFLMNLLERFVDENLPEMQKESVRLMVSGRFDGLPKGPRLKLAEAISQTSGNTGGTLVLALNYGGRAEIADAFLKMAADMKNGVLKSGDIDEERIKKYLYLPEIPDPDLIIRTSGELRLSNFLLYESAYSELYFTEVLWPDFDEEEFDRAVQSYCGRERRMGKIESQPINGGTVSK